MISGDAAPCFVAHVRLHFDKVRAHWVVLAAESCFVLDDLAADILRHCDGGHSVRQIIATLQPRYAGLDVAADVVALLQDFVEKKVIAVTSAPRHQ